MNAGYAIRRLGAADQALMSGLLDVFGRAFDDEPSYRDARPSDAYLCRLLGSDHVIVLVAMQSDEVVAGLAAYALQKFEQERSEIYIYDLAVAAEHRRLGIAEALIRSLQHEAAERGAWVIFVQADYGDDPAIGLYSKLGTREDVLHFDIAPA